MGALKTTPADAPVRESTVLIEARPIGGLRTALDVRHIGSRKPVRQVAVVRGFYNGALSASPAGRDVFFTTTSRPLGLGVTQVDLRTGKETTIGPGAFPAASPNGRSVALTRTTREGAGEIVVREIRRARTTTAGLDDVLPAGCDVVNSTVAWTGDGRTLVLDATARPQPTIDGPRTPQCGPAKDGGLLVVVPVDSKGAPGRAWTARMSDVGPIQLLASDFAQSRSILLVTNSGRQGSEIYLADLGWSRVQITRLRYLNSAIIYGFDPAGEHVLFMRNGSRDVWEGDVHGDAGDHVVFSTLLPSELVWR